LTVRNGGTEPVKLTHPVCTREPRDVAWVDETIGPAGEVSFQISNVGAAGALMAIFAQMHGPDLSFEVTERINGHTRPLR
jgi:hypothetical protein